MQQMKSFRIWFMLLVCMSIVPNSETAKILFMAPLATLSEKHFYEPLIAELGRSGHNVTVVTSSLSSDLPSTVKEIMPSTTEEQFGGFKKISNSYSAIDFLTSDAHVYFAEFCHKVYQNKEFQETINQEYDLVLSNLYIGTCFYGVLHKIGAPFIFIDSFPAASYLLEDLGTHIPSSIVPHPLVYFTDKMTFSERLVNFLVNWFTYAQNKFVIFPMMEVIYRNYLGQDIPSASDIHKNASLVFMNSHFTSSYHRPLMPDIVEIGCIHCKPAKALPQDLEEFVSSATNGFIFFSLGSTLNGSTLQEPTRDKILNVFSKLKQKVIWKWETETMTNLPKNVLLKKWLPQQDVLGHSKIKLFISQGGMLSTQQTIYHGVPALFFPVYFDQITNARNAVNQGMALELNLHDFSEQEFETAVNRIIHDSKFRENAETLSSIFHSQTSTPLERAMFWTNFILKHKGAPQLRSSARNLNIFQIHCVDVILSLFSTIIFIAFIITICGKKIISSLFYSNKITAIQSPKKAKIGKNSNSKTFKKE